MKINTGPWALLGVCVLLFCAGCDTVNHTQFKVIGAARMDGSRLAVSADQQEAVRQAMYSVAKELRFDDRTDRSVVANVIAAFGERDKINPITFVAYRSNDAILIDILHSNTEVGESQRYRKVQDMLLTELKQRMPPDRVTTQDWRRRAGSTAASPNRSKSPSHLTTTDWPTPPPK